LALPIALCSAQAPATITTLINIPIADILGHREAALSYGLTGNERSVDARYSHYGSLTVGLFDKAEVAVGNDFNGTSTFHAKLSLYESKTFALSGGIMNFEGRGHADTFLVGRMDFSGWRLHAGYLKDDADRLILGADIAIGKDLSGLLEYTSGPHGYTWAGLNAPVPGVNGLSLLVAVGMPSARADGIQHQVSLTYGFRF
jgi:hypothetical protein